MIFNAESLDPGIRTVVVRLRALGFNTTDSGDGVTKPENERIFHVPHVVCQVSKHELQDSADQLLSVLGPEWRIEASYCPNDGSSIVLATKECA